MRNNTVIVSILIIFKGNKIQLSYFNRKLLKRIIEFMTVTLLVQAMD